MRGSVRIEIRDAVSGALIEQRTVPNLVVDTGRAQLARGVSGVHQSAPTHFAVGTDEAEPDLSQTTLVHEVFRATMTQRTAAGVSAEFRYFMPSQVANGHTLKECGLFNAATGGTMFARAIYSEVVKTVSVTVLFVWTIVLDL